MELNLDGSMSEERKKIDEPSTQAFQIGIEIWVLVAYCFRLFVILTALGQIRVSQMCLCWIWWRAINHSSSSISIEWMNSCTLFVTTIFGLMCACVYSRYVHNIFVSTKPCVEFPLNFLKLFTPPNSTTIEITSSKYGLIRWLKVCSKLEFKLFN